MPLQTLRSVEPRVFYADTPPTTGTYHTGDRVLNRAPAPGAPAGWYYAGGVWVALPPVTGTEVLSVLDTAEAYWLARTWDGAAGTLADGSGNALPLTINGGAAQSGSRIVLDGSTGYLSAATDAAWEVGAAESLTVAIGFSVPDPDVNEYLIGISDSFGNGGGAEGWGIWNTATGNSDGFGYVGDGTDGAFVQASGMVADREHSLVLRLDRSDDTVEVWLDGVSQGTADAAAVGELTPARALEIGRADGLYGDLTFAGAAVYASALSDDDVARLALAVLAT